MLVVKLGNGLYELQGWTPPALNESSPPAAGRSDSAASEAGAAGAPSTSPTRTSGVGRGDVSRQSG
jgi:hypothetical protein